MLEGYVLYIVDAIKIYRVSHSLPNPAFL